MSLRIEGSFDETALKQNLAFSLPGVKPSEIRIRPPSPPPSPPAEPGVARSRRSRALASMTIELLVATEHSFVADRAFENIKDIIKRGGLNEALGVEVELVAAPILTYVPMLAPPPPPLPPERPLEEWSKEYGGLSPGAILVAGTKSVVRIKNAVFRGWDAQRGGAIAVHEGHMIIQHGTFENNTAMEGGAIYVQGKGKLTLDNCTFRRNRATRRGGAVFVASGSLILQKGTVLEDNEAPVGSQAMVATGEVVYELPAPLGRWMPSSFYCEPQRERCAPTNTSCKDEEQPELDQQPCNYEDHPELRGRPISVLTQGVYDAPLPYWCSAGYSGASLRTADQSGPSCAGVCPSGFYCTGRTPLPTICPAGKFCSEASVAPEDCLAGTFSARQALTAPSECTPCSMGASCRAGATSATPCRAGTHAPRTGLPVCLDCDAGKFQAATNATACATCPVGSFCPAGTVVPSACAPGTIGTRSGLASQAGCERTPPGYWSGDGTPVECVLGFYQPHYGAKSQGACIICPERSTTLHPAAASKDECVCKPHYYNPTTNGSYAGCLPCPVGTDCGSVHAILISDLPVSPGYWRPSKMSTDVRRCSDAGSGCPQHTGCPNGTSGCRGGRDSEDSCAPGLRGTFCELCDRTSIGGESVFYRGATSSTVAHCESCEGQHTLFIVASCLVAVLIAIPLVRRIVQANKKHEIVWHGLILIDRLKLHHKFKIVVGFFMIVTKVPSTYEIAMPGPVKQILLYFGALCNLYLDELMPYMQCFGLVRYYDRLLFFMVVPVILVLCMLLGVFVYLVAREWHKQREQDPRAPLSRESLPPPLVVVEKATPPMLYVLFFSYPIVTNAAFAAFKCHDFDEGAWLIVDVDVDCRSARYGELTRFPGGLAWIAILIYPVGLMLTVAVLLLLARSAVITGMHTRFSHAVAFLYRGKSCCRVSAATCRMSERIRAMHMPYT